jgi:hypothetical protein
MPPLRWTAIGAAVALAVVITVLSAAVLPPIPAAAASFFGLFTSGVLAGKLASAARVYHGAVTGAGYVACVALGLVPSGATFANPVTDTVAIIALDALRIALAALGGWSSRLGSSSDRGRGR